MFVNSESADNAMQILQSVFDALATRKNLSELDVKVKDSIQEAIMELAQKPFKPYSDIQSAVGNYVELRDLLSVDRKSWEDYESMVKDEMTRISMYLRDKGDEFGVAHQAAGRRPRAGDLVERLCAAQAPGRRLYHRFRS